MRRFSLPLLFLGAALAPSFLLAQATVAWTEFTRGVSVATDAAENVYTVDWDYNPAGDIYLTKRNADGVFQWEAKFDNTDNTRHEVATWVAVDHHGDILVSGTIRSGYSSPVNAASLLMKFDPAGNLLWRQVYESSFDGSSTRKCLVDADNNIYVLGLGTGPTGQVTKVKKFAPDGTPIWNYFDEAGIGAPLNFKLTPDNHLVISGRWIIGSGGGYAKIDLDGNNIWDYPAGFSLTVGDVAGDALGNAYVVHGSGTGTSLRKLSPAGSVLWDQPNPLTAFKVEVGSDGLPVISGFPGSGTPGAAFAKYNSAGTLLWQNLDADGLANALLLHGVMKMDAANNAYLAAGTLFQQGLCKINADGSEGWTVLISGGSFTSDFAFGTSSQSIYMVGGNTSKVVQETPCEAPIGLFSNNLTTTSARVNWTPVAGALAYEVQGRKASSAIWRTKTVAGSKNKLNVPGLLPGTDYVWRIRTVCDPSGTSSSYSPDQTFSTPALRTLEQTASIQVFPNPVSDQVNVVLNIPESLHNQPVVIRIVGLGTNVPATQILTASPGTITTLFEVSNYPAGLYHVIWTSGNQTGNQAFVVQR